MARRAVALRHLGKGVCMTSVAIIGGGPAGLMTAHLLEQRCGPGWRATLLEASDCLGGKMQTRRFDAAPVKYEAGVAECYAYDAIGPDPLRQLIRDLGLSTVPTGSRAVVLDGTLLRDETDLRRHFGDPALRAIQDFRRRASAMLPLASWSRGFVEDDNRHPWARRTAAEILDEVTDPVARKYLTVEAHSDMATEPHLTNGLVGLRNFLKSVPGYGAQYWIHGGMELLPRRLAAGLTRTDVELEAAVVHVSRTRQDRYAVRFRRGPTVVEREFDAVVLALPYSQLAAIEMSGERLRRAMAAHVAHYDSPGHYLRVSVLFDRPFWRKAFSGSWVMLDAFGGCCVYDESGRHDAHDHGVLGWLLAGADARSLCRADDRTLVGRVLDALPASLRDEGRACFVEAKVHRWAGALSGQPGGFRLRNPRVAHRPEPLRHPGVVVVGDYLFDSTLNGVLRSAGIAIDLLREVAGDRDRARQPQPAPAGGVDARSRLFRQGRRLLGRDAPARGPVLGLHLLAPAQCAVPVVELANAQRATVDEPDDRRAVRARIDDGM